MVLDDVILVDKWLQRKFPQKSKFNQSISWESEGLYKANKFRLF